MNRRSFLSTIGGLSFPSLLQAQYGKEVKAKNVIYIYLNGGISAQETWNPKPLVESEYRGPFKSIKTKTDDLLFSENFPLLASQTDKFSVIQSMTHGQAAHERGQSYMFTGYKPSPALNYPSIGSVFSKELGSRLSLPSYVTIPSTPNEFANSGFLSSKYNPFSLGSDPASPSFKVKDLNGNLTDQRRNLLELVDSKFKNEIKSDNVSSMDEFYTQAFSLMSSKEAQSAFDISSEPDVVRDSYGRSQIGQRLLMARRLVESGVRIAKVNYGSFDNHDNIKLSFDRQAPELDKALSYLFKDLDQRGLLQETLIVITSEFGRTPKINSTSGRDHWSRNFSTIIGGGGINNGLVYGSTDSLGGEVDENPVSPEDLFATVFHLAGIDPNKSLMTADLRPVDISRGKIISSLV